MDKLWRNRSSLGEQPIARSVPFSSVPVSIHRKRFGPRHSSVQNSFHAAHPGWKSTSLKFSFMGLARRSEKQKISSHPDGERLRFAKVSSSNQEYRRNSRRPINILPPAILPQEAPRSIHGLLKLNHALIVYQVPGNSVSYTLFIVLCSLTVGIKFPPVRALSMAYSCATPPENSPSVLTWTFRTVVGGKFLNLVSLLEMWQTSSIPEDLRFLVWMLALWSGHIRGVEIHPVTSTLTQLR